MRQYVSVNMDVFVHLDVSVHIDVSVHNDNNNLFPIQYKDNTADKVHKY